MIMDSRSEIDEITSSMGQPSPASPAFARRGPGSYGSPGPYTRGVRDKHTGGCMKGMDSGLCSRGHTESAWAAGSADRCCLPALRLCLPAPAGPNSGTPTKGTGTAAAHGAHASPSGRPGSSTGVWRSGGKGGSGGGFPGGLGPSGPVSSLRSQRPGSGSAASAGMGSPSAHRASDGSRSGGGARPAGDYAYKRMQERRETEETARRESALVGVGASRGAVEPMG